MADYYSELEEKSRSATEETPTQTIRRVRGHTCYAALRTIIAVVVAPGYLVAVFFVLAGFGIVAMPLVHGETPTGIICVILGVVSFILTLAIHQALRLLVDIADLLIEQARHK